MSRCLPLPRSPSQKCQGGYFISHPPLQPWPVIHQPGGHSPLYIALKSTLLAILILSWMNEWMNDVKAERDNLVDCILSRDDGHGVTKCCLWLRWSQSLDWTNEAYKWSHATPAVMVGAGIRQAHSWKASMCCGFSHWFWLRSRKVSWILSKAASAKTMFHTETPTTSSCCHYFSFLGFLVSLSSNPNISILPTPTNATTILAFALDLDAVT